MEKLAQNENFDGVETRLHDGEARDSVVVEHIQDVGPILARNKALCQHDNGYGKSREWKRVASIPLIVVEQWMLEGVSIFDPNCRSEVRRRLNSSDWQFLRTAEGEL